MDIATTRPTRPRGAELVKNLPFLLGKSLTKMNHKVTFKKCWKRDGKSMQNTSNKPHLRSGIGLVINTSATISPFICFRFSCFFLSFFCSCSCPHSRSYLLLLPLLLLLLLLLRLAVLLLLLLLLSPYSGPYSCPCSCPCPCPWIPWWFWPVPPPIVISEIADSKSAVPQQSRALSPTNVLIGCW